MHYVAICEHRLHFPRRGRRYFMPHNLSLYSTQASYTPLTRLFEGGVTSCRTACDFTQLRRFTGLLHDSCTSLTRLLHASYNVAICEILLILHADICWRMLTYADVCWAPLTNILLIRLWNRHAQILCLVASRVFVCDDITADVCWRMLTHADVFCRMYRSIQSICLWR
jgi:hypothetical protein